MRPRTLDEFVGQEDLLAPGRPLRDAIERDLLQSIILWGPPGTGKTTLARLIADVTRAHFISFSAVLAGIKEIKAVMAEAEQRAPPARPPHDPVHRRDPPLQQGAAGRLPAPRRGRRHRPDRRDHREPVVRGELGAAVAVAGVRPGAALARSDARRSSSARCATPSAAWAARPSTWTRGAGRRSRGCANGDARMALNLLESPSPRRPLLRTPAGSTSTSPSCEQAVQRRALLYDKSARSTTT